MAKVIIHKINFFFSPQIIHTIISIRAMSRKAVFIAIVNANANNVDINTHTVDTNTPDVNANALIVGVNGPAVNANNPIVNANGPAVGVATGNIGVALHSSNVNAGSVDSDFFSNHIIIASNDAITGNYDNFFSGTGQLFSSKKIVCNGVRNIAQQKRKENQNKNNLTSFVNR